MLKRRIPDDRVRASFDRQKAIFSGEEFQQQMKMTASAGPGCGSKVLSESHFAVSNFHSSYPLPDGSLLRV